jgi:hypothetical protein
MAQPHHTPSLTNGRTLRWRRNGFGRTVIGLVVLLLGVRIPVKEHQSAPLHRNKMKGGGDQIGAKNDDAYLSTR